MTYKRWILCLGILITISGAHGMSHTKALIPILALLHTAQKNFFGENQWNIINDTQKLLVNRYVSYTNELEKLLPEELKCCVSLDINVVNQFLKENNVGIQLKPFDNPGFSIASLMNVTCQWKVSGQKSKILYEAKWYPSVLMRYDAHNSHYIIKKLSIYPNPIVYLATHNGDQVCMTIADQERRGFDLLRIVEALMEKSIQENNNDEVWKDITNYYESIQFPMVDLIHQPDITWLLNMSNNTPDNKEYGIIQALQQTTFKMNEEGVQMQSSAAMQCALMTTAMKIKPSLLLDKPFFLWILRPGMKMPVFTGYIHPYDWQEPEKK